MIIFRRQLSHAAVCFHNYEIFWNNKHCRRFERARRDSSRTSVILVKEWQTIVRIKSKWLPLFHKNGNHVFKISYEKLSHFLSFSLKLDYEKIFIFSKIDYFECFRP